MRAGRLEKLTYTDALEQIAAKARDRLIELGVPVEGRSNPDLIETYRRLRAGAVAKKRIAGRKNVASNEAESAGFSAGLRPDPVL